MKTILLVDDSTTILLSISSILRKAGYNVEKAASAEAALQVFNNEAEIDLLITRSITRPIIAAVGAAERLAEGDLTVRLASWRQTKCRSSRTFRRALARKRPPCFTLGV